MEREYLATPWSRSNYWGKEPCEWFQQFKDTILPHRASVRTSRHLSFSLGRIGVGYYSIVLGDGEKNSPKTEESRAKGLRMLEATGK